jgi:PP-loop superfamily ATP-utilizing enzyme
MTDTMMIPVSFGEVLDKITILEIKSERINDPVKLANIRLELDELNRVWARSLENPASVNPERRELKAVNEKLWDIEDAIREQESAGDFGERFVELARQVYFTNDERAALKKRVNLALGSRFVEEKSYRDYCRSG